MAITQIIPSNGWYHVHELNGRVYITALGAWALMDNGEVVGLVPVEGSPSGRSPVHPRLEPVAPIHARYCHETDQDFAELKMRAQSSR